MTPALLLRCTRLQQSVTLKQQAALIRFWAGKIFTLLCLCFSLSANATDFVVSNGANAGTGSLRQALTDANATGPGPHTITFTVTGTITITSSLPALTASGVTIDGESLVTISGPAANDNGVALIVLGTGANNTVVKNLTFQNTGTQPINVSVALSGITLENLVLRQTGTDYMNHGIYVGGASTNMTIKNVMITDIQRGAYWGVRFANTVTGLTIDGLRIYNTGANYVGAGNDIRGIQFYGAVSNTIIKNSTINLDAPTTADDGNYGIYFNSTVTGLTLDSVQVHDAEIYNFYVAGAATNVTIDKCIFTNKVGSTSNQQVRFQSAATNVSVTNSLFDADMLNTTDDGNHGLLFIGNMQGITAQNNTFHEQDANGIYSSGLNNDNILIKGNLFNKIGIGSSDTYGGIQFVNMRNTTSDGGPVRITQNTFRENNGVAMMLRPGNGGNYTIPNLLVDSNTITGTKTSYGGIRINYIDKIVISKNSIYNNVGRGIELTDGTSANCNYQGTNTPKLLSSVETGPGSGLYNIGITMPSICGTGLCDLELFSTEAGVPGAVGGQHYVNTFTGLSAGSHTLSNVTAAFDEITSAPYGRWTATLRLPANGCGTSEFSNKIAIKVNGPAGVDNGIALWLNPDFADPGNMINGLGWDDFSGNNRNFSAVASDPERITGGFNYNHYINFDGNDYLRPAAAFSNAFTAGEAISVTRTATLAENRGNPYDFGGNSNPHYTWSNNAVYNDFGTNDRLGWNPLTKAIPDTKPGITTSVSILGAPVDVKQWHIYGTKAAAGNWGFEFNGGKQSASTTTNTIHFGLQGGKEYVGASYGYVFRGDIAEQILYNRVLTATERQRVNTYLGVKYGLTLYHNYIASDGTTIWWDLLANTGYNKGIAGLARDKISVLNQKQSYSVSASDVVRIGVGAVLHNANEDNEVWIKNDRSAFMWGTDSAATTYTLPYVTAYSDTRMARVWRVRKTNWSDTTIIIKLQGGNRNRYLLVSSDPLFPAGSTDKYILNDTGAVILNSNLIANGYYFTFSNKIIAPGCVTNGIQAWLRADDANADGSLWPDYSGKDKHASQAIATAQPALAANAVNFNPAFDFNNSSTYLNFADNLSVSGTNPFTVVGVGTRKAAANWDAFLSHQGTATGGFLFGFDAANKGAVHRTGTGNTITGTFVYNTLNMPYLVTGTRDINNFALYKNGSADGTIVSSHSYLTTTAMRLGNRATSADVAFNGYMPEVVVYNRALSSAELQRVHSYLSLKYGVTYNNGATDYLAGDGSTKMWDATVNAAYNKDIAGIGKDTCDNLHQKQSRSVNTGSLVALALGDAIGESNAANTQEVTNNSSFLVWGDNGAAITYINNITDPGATATLRMSRVWRIDKTNWTDQDITIKLNGNTSNAFLLISNSDAGFVTIDQELAISSDSTVTFSSSLLPDGAYFTFAKEIRGPGFVNNGVKLWLRADDGISSPDTWLDFSGNGTDATQTTVANQPQLSATINFNPVYDFNGTSHFLNIANPLLGTGNISYSVFTAAMPASVSSGYHYMYVEGANVGSQRVSDGRLDSRVVNANVSNDVVSTTGDLVAATPYILGYTRNATSSPYIRNLYRNYKQVATNSSTTALNKTNSYQRIGNSSGTEYWNGYVGEVVVYDRDLSATESQKVQSYLAIKYGITLDQTTPTDYLATDSSLIWKASDNTGYVSHIAGIGRDDKTRQYQKQSRSVTDTLITIALGATVAADNASNTETIDDLAFIVWANNNAATAYTEPVTGLANATTRMLRVWKVDKTNTWADQDITIKADKNGARYLLVHATDPAFGAGTAEYALDFATGSVTLNTADLPDGAYFTLATKFVGPGYVNNGIQAWLRADYGGTVSNWSDFSGLQNNAVQTAAANQPVIVAKGINYNPVLDFDGSNDYMDIASSLGIGTAATDYTVVGLSSRKTTGTGDAILAQNANATNSYVFYFSSGNKLANHKTSGTVIQSTGTYGTANTPMLSAATRSGTGLNLFTNGVVDGTGTISGGFLANNMRIGNRATSADLAYAGIIGEVVMYNRALNNTELQRVHSYLSLKYGITYNGGASDYLASDGATKMWTLADNTGYTTRITGIGRDDSTNLYQKQSISVDAGLVTIAIGGIALSNPENPDTIGNNNSYLVFADNNALATYTESVTATPLSTYRMGRVWKVDKTSWADADITLKLNKRVKNVYLLISTDAGFATVDQELALNETDSTVSLNSSLLPDGAYFTFGSKLYVPGGVAPTALWLRPDLGTSTTTDSTGVETWADNSPLGNDALQATETNQPLYMDNATDNINFNPVLKFNGSSEFMDMDVSLLPLGTSARSLFATVKPSTISGGTDYIVGWGSNATSAGMGLANVNGAGHFVGVGNNVSSAPFWQVNVPNEITGVWLGSGGAATIYSKTLQKATANKIWTTGSAAGARLGGAPWSTTEGWAGTIGDVIVYPAALDAGNRLKISTYLAIKYGYTIDQTSPTNYLATDSSIIWDATTNAAYKYGITGIGRDDVEGLVQKQSRNTDTTRLRIAVGLGALAETNTANTGEFTDDNSYLLWGDDNAATTYQAALPGTTLANYRMARIWKAQETGTVGSVQIAVPATAVPNQEEAFLIISDDASFDGTDNLVSLSAITLNGVKYLAAEADLTGGQYFTFASDLKLPGGVATPALWLRADKGVDNATDNTATTAWTDYGNQVNAATQATVANQPLYMHNETDNINFNPVLKFDGLNDALNLDISKLPTGNTARSMIGVAMPTNVTGIRHFLGWGTTGSANQFMGMGTNATAGGYMSTVGSTTANATYDLTAPSLWMANQPNEMMVTWAGVTGNASVYSKMRSVLGPLARTWNTGVNNARIGSGANGTAASQFWQGNIGEVILYDRELTTIERQRVSTYLAIKYGYTIDQTSANDYVATDWDGSTGTKLWTAATNGAYKNNIAGIGRDDVEGLVQKQSRSINAGMQVAMGLGAIAADNLANENSFLDDKNYLVWGDDNGALTEQTTELPAHLAGSKRLGREWKVQLTGESSAVQIQLDLSSVSVSAASASEIYLLVDTDGDGDFTTGTVTSLQASDYTAGVVTFDNVSFSTGHVFTLATQALVVNVNVKAILQGAYNSGMGMMNTTLNSSGILQASASSQPYSAAPFSYAGTEAVGAGFFAANPGIVDWVLVELRDETTPATLLASRAAFIKSDGSIVDVDGISPVLFPNMVAGNYHIAVRHRNHLSIRTGAAQALNAAALSYDFTTAQEQVYQNPAITTNAAMKDLGGGKFAMWAANGNSNTVVSYSGINNDYSYLTGALGGDLTSSLNNVYHKADYNLNGIVNASGLKNDYTVLTSAVLNGQLTIIFSEHQ